MPDYSKKELRELYDNIPKDLQEAVFSEKVADIIYNACTENGLETDKEITRVAKYTGYVLLGLVSPNKFSETLEKEMKITKTQAKNISQEIKRLAFSPIKESLENLYQIKIKIGSPKKTFSRKSIRKDRYRESIE
jgi:hypothetical protein